MVGRVSTEMRERLLRLLIGLGEGSPEQAVQEARQSAQLNARVLRSPMRTSMAIPRQLQDKVDKHQINGHLMPISKRGVVQ